jgi:tetratricopeptide (TPR) repeat protein
MTILANHYIPSGAAKYQEDDLEGAIVEFEKVMLVLPDDTTSYYYAGIVGNSLENHDRTIKYWRKYYEKGGTTSDGFSIIINIYSQQKDDKEKALEVAKEARLKFPNDDNFPKIEIGLLIDLGKIDEAKTGLENAIKNEPDNKVLHFYLGYVNAKLEKWDEAKTSYEAALKIDPTYFDAQYYLAQIYLIEAEKIRAQIGSLGISAADQKKKLDLDKILVERYKTALPFWEKAEKLKTEDLSLQLDVLDKLSNIYYYLGEDAKQRAVDQKIKLLGGDQ